MIPQRLLDEVKPLVEGVEPLEKLHIPESFPVCGDCLARLFGKEMDIICQYDWCSIGLQKDEISLKTTPAEMKILNNGKVVFQ